MSPVIVLVTFYSCCGETEKLALAAAVGAVQARTSIRLRRLPDHQRPPECLETLERMRKEYVPPAEADVLGADVLIIATPGRFDESSPELAEFLSLLRRLESQGKLEGKVGAAISPSKRSSLSGFMLDLGLITVPAGPGEGVDRATAHGRRAAAVARAIK